MKIPSNFNIKNILKYGKFIFPAIAFVLAAVVAVVALNVRSKYQKKQEIIAEENAQAAEQETLLSASEETQISVPLETNESEPLEDLFNNYYSCLSDGDMDSLENICDGLSESERLRFGEQSKYLSYSISQIYQQAGPEEGSYIAYVYCYVTFDEYPDLAFPAYNGYFVKTAEDGSMYIVLGSLTDEENQYIAEVASEDDVVELNNAITVEYNDMVVEHPEILDYLVELDEQVSTAIGEQLAELNADNSQEVSDETESNTDEAAEEDGDSESEEDDTPKYVTATTRVNVRASASAESERLGEVFEGDTLGVIEILENGWTKVIFEGGEGYISSEFLSPVQNADSVETIGMMTANDNVNVRSKPSTDGQLLGALTTGDTFEVTAVEDGWVAIKYNSIIAYVNADFVSYSLFN